MSKGHSIRVAMVKFTAKGTSYPARCEDRSLIAGSRVNAEMWVGTPKASFMDGEIAEISFSRYSPTGRVAGKADKSCDFDLPGMT